jgi:hypothetical protein
MPIETPAFDSGAVSTTEPIASSAMIINFFIASPPHDLTEEEAQSFARSLCRVLIVAWAIPFWTALAERSGDSAFR